MQLINIFNCNIILIDQILGDISVFNELLIEKGYPMYVSEYEHLKLQVWE